MAWFVFMACAFLCGSIPTGLWIARSRGVDIRAHGSGNIGATNVGRVLGARAGLACFSIDVAKGFVPVFAVGWWSGLVAGPQPDARDAWLWLGVMSFAVLGHMFTPWAGFKGGKGVATGLGALLGVYPYLTVPAIGALAVWTGAVALWRYVSLASILAALSLPVFVIAWAAVRAVVVLEVPEGDLIEYRDRWIPFVAITSLLGAAVVVRHRTNIRRLLDGRENRLGKRAASGPDNTRGPGPAGG